eukprot:8152308-Pyramimonas_sp.AAC.1
MRESAHPKPRGLCRETWFSRRCPHFGVARAVLNRAAAETASPGVRESAHAARRTTSSREGRKPRRREHHAAMPLRETARTHSHDARPRAFGYDI